MIEQLKNNKTGNFFLLAGPCVIEGEEMAMRIAEKIVNITDKLGIPYDLKVHTVKPTVLAWIHSWELVMKKR